jgi:hypothetical protein
MWDRGPPSQDGDLRGERGSAIRQLDLAVTPAQSSLSVPPNWRRPYR